MRILQRPFTTALLLAVFAPAPAVAETPAKPASKAKASKQEPTKPTAAKPAGTDAKKVAPASEAQKDEPDSAEADASLSLSASSEDAEMEAEAEADAPTDAEAESGSSSGPSEGFFDNYSLRLKLESAGPLLFRDTPDGIVEETSVFQFGGGLAAVFGNELRDTHRFGLGVSYVPTARSESRSVAFIPISLIYEVGHPIILQGTLGANIATGSAGFAENYTGIEAGMALRYSFREPGEWSSVMVSPGLAAKANLSTKDMGYSSVFLGLQVEVMYDTNN